MKRLIYITYLGLLALLLISCEKENIAPAASEEFISLDNMRSGGACPNYSYQTKTGTVQLGTVGGEFAIIGFNPTVTPTQQQTILSGFSIFDVINGDAYFESGIATLVKLQPGTTCNQVESFMKQLEKNQAVDYVVPVFDGTGVFSFYDWVSPSPELIVTLTDPQHYRFLEQFARNTKTQIVASFDEVTFILAANKKSSGNVLELSSLLNSSPKVDAAEPNFYGQMAGVIKHGRKMPDAKPIVKYN